MDLENIVQVGVLRLWPERLRVLVDVGNWYTYGAQATRDTRAHRPGCDFAAETLGERPRPCLCWTLKRRPFDV